MGRRSLQTEEEVLQIEEGQHDNNEPRSLLCDLLGGGVWFPLRYMSVTKLKGKESTRELARKSQCATKL